VVHGHVSAPVSAICKNCNPLVQLSNILAQRTTASKTYEVFVCSKVVVLH